MLYRFIQILIKIGLRLYYSEIKVRNQHLLEHDGPLIIIADRQHPGGCLAAWKCEQATHLLHDEGNLFQQSCQDVVSAKFKSDSH